MIADMIAGNPSGFVIEHWAERLAIASRMRSRLKELRGTADKRENDGEEDSEMWRSISNGLYDEIISLDALIDEINEGLARATNIHDYGTENPSPEDVYGVPPQGAIR